MTAVEMSSDQGLEDFVQPTFIDMVSTHEEDMHKNVAHIHSLRYGIAFPLGTVATTLSEQLHAPRGVGFGSTVLAVLSVGAMVWQNRKHIIGDNANHVYDSFTFKL